MDILLAVILSLFLVLYGTMFAYVRKLEDTKCECSASWQRTYIKWFLGLLIVYNTFLVVLALLDLQDPLTSGIIGAVLSTVISVGVIVFVVAGLQYINNVKESSCKCSAGLGRNVLFVWALVLGATVVVTMANVGASFLSTNSQRVEVTSNPVPALGRGRGRR